MTRTLKMKTSLPRIDGWMVLDQNGQRSRYPSESVAVYYATKRNALWARPFYIDGNTIWARA